MKPTDIKQPNSHELILFLWLHLINFLLSVDLWDVYLPDSRQAGK